MKYDVFVRYEEGMKEETFYLYGTLPELADSLERYVKPFILQLSEDQHLSIGQFISPTRYKSAKQLTKPIKLTLHAHIERPLKPEEERGDVPLPPEAQEGISRNGQRTLIIPDNPVTFDMIPVRGRVKVIARCLDPALSDFYDALVSEFKDEWGEPAEDLDATPTPAEDGAGGEAILGEFFTTIRGVRMDLATFGDFLARLRKDELTFERVEARRWQAKWYGCDTGYVAALPVGDELNLDFYLMRWDQVSKPVAYEEDSGEITIEREPNVWARIMVDRVRADLQELGVLGDDMPTKDGAGETEHFPMPAQYVFHKRSEMWEIAFEGEMFYLKDIKGLNYVACLLANPDRDFDVMELVIVVEKTLPDATIELYDEEDRDSMSGGSDDYRMVDNQTIGECQQRLHELGEERREAKELGDEGKLQAINEEIVQIEEYLRTATGLGGRARPFDSDREKARSSVQKAIKRATKKIGKHDPALCDHLLSSIKTGYSCSYKPDSPMSWDVTL